MALNWALSSSAAKNFADLDDTSDKRLESKITTLKSVFPLRTSHELQNILTAYHGSLPQAIDHITGGQESSHNRSGPNSQSATVNFSSKSNSVLNVENSDSDKVNDIFDVKERELVKTLRKICCSHTVNQLCKALIESKWDINEAAERLFSDFPAPAVLRNTESKLPAVKPVATIPAAANVHSDANPSGTLITPANNSSHVGLRPKHGIIGRMTLHLHDSSIRQVNSVKAGEEQRVTIGKFEKLDLLGEEDTINNDSDTPFEKETTVEKIGQLFAMFPEAGRDGCGVILQLQDGNILQAYEELYKECGHGLADGSRVGGNGNDTKLHFPNNNLGNLDRRGKSNEQGQSSSNRHLQKRRTESSRQSATKKARVSNGAAPIRDSEPAREWVQKCHSGNGDISIELDYGIHPCQLSKSALRDIQFFKDYFIANPAETLAKATIKVPGISRDIFDLTLQWVGSKEIMLDPQEYSKPGNKITALLDLVLTGTKLGFTIEDPNSRILGYLKDILTEDRLSLKGRHITAAFTKLEAGNPVREIFAQAAFRPYVEHRDDPTDNRGSENAVPAYEDSDELDEARRRAFKRGFQFDRELKLIPEFRNQLRDMFEYAWRNREVEKPKNSRFEYTKLYFEDPLTNERFLCN